MRGGEVSLRVPHSPARLHLIGDQLVGVVHLHGAVDDAVVRRRLQVADLQHHHLKERPQIFCRSPSSSNLNLKCEHDVRLGEGGDVRVVVLRARDLTLSPARE